MTHIEEAQRAAEALRQELFSINIINHPVKPGNFQRWRELVVRVDELLKLVIAEQAKAKATSNDDRS